MHSITPVQIHRFAASLCDSYRQGFDEGAISQHLRVAVRRGDSEAEVGAFQTELPDTIGLCIIAEDKPGLLAAISEALLLNALDVVSARIFTRLRPDGKAEAVDLFWVRPQLRSLEASRSQRELALAVQETLLGLLTGNGTIVHLDRTAQRTQGSAATTLVRFIEDSAGAFATLEVETGDRSGLLLTITRALTNSDVQIIGSLVNTTGTLVFDRFQLRERDGSLLEPKRRRQVQQAVLAALDGASFQAAVA
jgi:[protein-PII] uridylyltransferase